MLSKVDINLLIKLTRFNFVPHRGSIESMTKKHRKHHKRSLRWNLGERRSLQIFMNHFFSSLDNYLGADNLGAHTGIPVAKCLWIRHCIYTCFRSIRKTLKNECPP